MKPNDLLKTPAWVYRPLGHFDLDPCAALDTEIAEVNICLDDNLCGLEREWFGFVWCNPPFSEKEKWIQKMIDHGNGILLLPERGSAPWFGPTAQASGQYFVMGKKINFIGGSSSNNVGSVLFCFGKEAKKRVVSSDLPGHFVSVQWLKERSHQAGGR